MNYNRSPSNTFKIYGYEMKPRVELFSTDNLQDLEDVINQWLEANHEECEVSNVSFSTSVCPDISLIHNGVVAYQVK